MGQQASVALPSALGGPKVDPTVQEGQRLAECLRRVHEFMTDPDALERECAPHFDRCGRDAHGDIRRVELRRLLFNLARTLGSGELTWQAIEAAAVAGTLEPDAATVNKDQYLRCAVKTVHLVAKELQDRIDTVDAQLRYRAEQEKEERRLAAEAAAAEAAALAAAEEEEARARLAQGSKWAAVAAKSRQGFAGGADDGDGDPEDSEPYSDEEGEEEEEREEEPEDGRPSAGHIGAHGGDSAESAMMRGGGSSGSTHRATGGPLAEVAAAGGGAPRPGPWPRPAGDNSGRRAQEGLSGCGDGGQQAQQPQFCGPFPVPAGRGPAAGKGAAAGDFPVPAGAGGPFPAPCGKGGSPMPAAGGDALPFAAYGGYAAPEAGMQAPPAAPSAPPTLFTPAGGGAAIDGKPIEGMVVLVLSTEGEFDPHRLTVGDGKLEIDQDGSEGGPSWAQRLLGTASNSHSTFDLSVLDMAVSGAELEHSPAMAVLPEFAVTGAESLDRMMVLTFMSGEALCLWFSVSEDCDLAKRSVLVEAGLL